jgi:pilus assembly protein CpaF
MMLLILLAAAIFLILNFRHVTVTEQDDTYDNPYSIEYLVEYVNRIFGITKRRSLKDMNLTRTEYQKELKKKSDLRAAERQAAFGDVQAKRYIKALILSIISDGRREHPITLETINRVIPFNVPSDMSSRDKFETLLYVYQNTVDKSRRNARTYGADALNVLLERHKLLRPNDDGSYRITRDDIDRVYQEVMTSVLLSYEDKRAIVAQRIFEDLEGFGPVDLLLDMSIDEVQGGVSGIPTGAYKLKNAEIMKNAKFSYESIWIVVHGLNIKLDFLSFGTQEELVRICQNIYKYNAPNVLSRNQGYVVATMLDGSRIVVVRPEFSESYAFLARKFDSTPSIAPEALLKDKNSDLVIKLINWLVKGEQNIAITGDQGSGKTTMLKSIIRFIPESYALRIQELTPELNIRYAYPNRNVLTFRETENVSAQQGLDLQKKTSGTVNIIGEVADAQGASWVIQTSGVASRQTMFTNHSKSVYDLVTSFRNSLMQVNNYQNDRSADIMVAKAINFDIHMERENEIRRISRITEIIPDEAQEYEPVAEDDKDLMAKTMVNVNDYFRRVTDRVSFKSRDLVVYDREARCYRIVALPTEEKQEEMFHKMSTETQKSVSEDKKVLEAFVEPEYRFGAHRGGR